MSKCFCYDDDKITFEYPTDKFISSTVLVLQRLEPSSLFSRHIIRRNVKTTKPGRIDIAILDGSSYFDKPKCAIEVKGNDPAKQLLISDIRRNLEYFKHTAPTRSSALESALNCSFYSYNTSIKKNYCVTTQNKGGNLR